MRTGQHHSPQWDICFSVTDEDINDLIKMRVILEQGAIREAMEKNANNVIVELSNILSKSAKINAERDTQAYLKLDHDFHYVFVKYADNKYISQAHLLISARLLAIRYRLDFTAEYITSSNRGHATILDMLKTTTSRASVILSRTTSVAVLQNAQENFLR